MKQFIQYSVLVGSLVASGCAIGQESKSEWQVGLIAGSFNAPYLQMDSREFVFPLINYHGEKLSVDGYSLSYELGAKEDCKLSFTLRPGMDYLDASYADNQVLDGLADREVSLYAGLSLDTHNKLGAWEGFIGQDISGHSQGYKMSLQYRYPLALTEDWVVTPMVKWEINSDKVSQYYYGIDGEDTALFAPFEIGRTHQTEVGIATHYQLSAQWQFTAMLSWHKLDDDVLLSPIIEADHYHHGMMALIYQF